MLANQTEVILEVQLLHADFVATFSLARWKVQPLDKKWLVHSITSCTTREISWGVHNVCFMVVNSWYTSSQMIHALSVSFARMLLAGASQCIFKY